LTAFNPGVHLIIDRSRPMTTPNPYRYDPAREIEIVYEGQEQGFFCYRLKLRGHDGFQAHLFKTQVYDFLLNEARKPHHFGNKFGTMRGEPTISFKNPGEKDFFVLFTSKVDMALFERQFTVLGATPIRTAA
jgi:hypothetical protein